MVPGFEFVGLPWRRQLRNAICRLPVNFCPVARPAATSMFFGVHARFGRIFVFGVHRQSRNQRRQPEDFPRRCRRSWCRCWFVRDSRSSVAPEKFVCRVGFRSVRSPVDRASRASMYHWFHIRSLSISLLHRGEHRPTSLSELVELSPQFLGQRDPLTIVPSPDCSSFSGTPVPRRNWADALNRLKLLDGLIVAAHLSVLRGGPPPTS